MKAVTTLHLQSLLDSHSEDFVDERDLSHDVYLANTINLTFMDHIHHLIALENMSGYEVMN